MSAVRKPRARALPESLRALVLDLDARLQGGDGLFSDVMLPHDEWAPIVEAAQEEHERELDAVEKNDRAWGVDAFDLVSHLVRQRAFSEATFGPGDAADRLAGIADHINKEQRELEAAPNELEEWIDVVLLSLDGAWRTGAGPHDIARALAAKQEKNERRKWPDWRTAAPGKAIEHDRSFDAVPPARKFSKPFFVTKLTGDRLCDDDGAPIAFDDRQAAVGCAIREGWREFRVIDCLGTLTDRVSRPAEAPKKKRPTRATKKFPLGAGETEICTACARQLGEHDGTKCPTPICRVCGVDINGAPRGGAVGPPALGPGEKPICFTCETEVKARREKPAAADGEQLDLEQEARAS